MDPEGIREIFYAQSSVALEYGVHAAVKSLPYLVRIHDSFVKGLHLPLTRKLPKRLDTTLQLSPGLHALDAIVFADIDPTVLDADDLWNLQAYVEAGGGLLLLGGPNTFTRAQRGWGPLREILPIAYPLTPQKRTKLWNDVFRGEAPPVLEIAAAEHPVTRGLQGPLGRTGSWHPCALHQGDVLAMAGDMPLIAARTFGEGRVMTVAAWPDSQPDNLFTAPGWSDLLRQAIMWLFGRDADLAILGCEADCTPIPHCAKRTFALTLDPAAALTTATATLRKADPGWLAVGREPQYGEAVDVPVVISGEKVALDFDPPAPGCWKVRLEVAGDGWANAREFTVDARSPRELALAIRDGRYIAAPGWTLPLRVAANAAVTGTVRFVDFRGNELSLGGALASFHTVLSNGGYAVDIDLPLPRIEPGDYEVVASADGEEARVRFAVTDEVRVPGLTFVAPGGFGQSERLVRYFHDYYRDRGFNAACGVGGYSEYLSQRDGMVQWGEYVGASLLKTHSHYGDEGTKTTTPCVLDPEHAVALRAHLETRFRQYARSPKLTFIEILDEPHLLRANVCHCARCQAAFRTQYGYDLPTWDEAIAARDRRTKDYFEWVVDYAAKAFDLGYDIWKSFGPGPGLNHVLCAMGSGTSTARHAIAEGLNWARSADLLEFDVYNYMYPNWRGSYQLMWNEFHYMAGHFRFMSLRNGKPLGFFIQVTDRDAPVMPWNPVRAPSETLYTALGAGAKYFHLMAQGYWTNTQNCREEKFTALGEDITKVRKAAPLLEKAQSPRSAVAMVFAFHDRLYRTPEHWLPEGYVGLGFYMGEHRPYDTTWPYHKAPINVCELLVRAFGESDVVDQRAFCDGGLDGYQGFVLTGVDYITDDDAKALVRFVEDGGLLICDHVPAHSTDGGASDILALLFTGEAKHFDGVVTTAESTFGQGKTLRFSADLNELYTGAVERDDVYLRDRVEAAVRAFFFDNDLRPHAGTSDPWVETAALYAPDSTVMTVVNHFSERKQARLTLYHPAQTGACIDLITGHPYPFTRGAEGLDIEVNLGEREGLLLGVFPDQPAAIAAAGGSARAGEAFPVVVTLTTADGKPALGDHIVEVQVTDPSGRPWMRGTGRFCTAGGALKLDAPLGVNALPGVWTVTAYDPVSRKVATTTVTVA